MAGAGEECKGVDVCSSRRDVIDVVVGGRAGGVPMLEFVLPDYQRTMDGHTNVATRYPAETRSRAAFTPRFTVPKEPQAREPHEAGGSGGLKVAAF